MQVFITSPWVPPEFIGAHGLEPRGVWFAAEPSQLPLGAGICAFAQAMIRLAETRPESAFIFSTHCDQLRRGFDALTLALPGRVFLFNLPATWQGPVGERIFGSELERLGSFLLKIGGYPPTAKALGESMARYRLARSRLIEAGADCSARQYGEALARFHWDGTVNLGGEAQHARADGIALALVGGPLPTWQMDLLDAIERARGRVVLNATEAGERSLGLASQPEADYTASHALPDLLQLLTRSCLERCVDVFQRPNTRLYLWLKERLAARQVRGILLWHFVGCDLWRAEAQSLREAFGLPVLLLAASEAGSAALRQSTRIQAFVESLG